MKQKTLVIPNLNGMKPIEIGHVFWVTNGPIGFKVPQEQEVTLGAGRDQEEADVYLSGLQYVDFSDFLLMVEVSITAETFMLDIRDVDWSNAEVHQLKPVSSYREFNAIVGQRIAESYL